MSKRVILFIAAILALAACGGRSAGGSAYVPDAVSPMLQSRVSNAAIKPGEYLYLGFYRTDFGGGSAVIIAGFPTSANGKVAPSSEIAAQLGGQNGFVPCYSGILGKATANGRIYVLDGYENRTSNGQGCEKTPVYEVRVYSMRAQGSARPERLIRGPHTLLANKYWFPSGGIAVGKDGTLYIGLQPSFAAATKKPLPPSKTPGILEFAPTANGDAMPVRTAFLRTSTGSKTIAASPGQMAIDKHGNIADLYGPYPAGISGCTGFQAFAPDPSGTPNPITQFSPGIDAKNYLQGAYSLAISGTKAYIANQGGLTTGKKITRGVFVYALTGPLQPPCPNTPVAPLAHVGGKNTKLDNPEEVATDGAGTMYVLNEQHRTNTGKLAGVNAVYAFPATANGDVAPIRSIIPIIPKAALEPEYYALAIGRVP